MIGVWKTHKLDSVPETYILHRWKKNVKRSHTKVRLSYTNWQRKPEWRRFDILQKKFEVVADNVIYSDAHTKWMEDMLDKMIEESEKLKESSGNLTLASLRDHGEKVGDPISRKRAKHNQIKRKQTMVKQALKKRKQKENNLQTQASMNNVYVPMMTSPATQASVNNVYVSVMNEANSSMNKYVEMLSQASTTDQLVNVAFTGNYNEYFGFATDVDVVIYLMPVNDMIHGLYPEAVSIDEYVCFF
ncbi:hypothetical protein Dimus_012304 [Dionaea muscipula]